MMKTLNPYITFNGNCREAMEFYQQCLGGRLSFQTVGESPMSKKMPPTLRKSILHAVLTCENFELMGSDMVSETGLVKGNAIAIVLNCNNEKETRDCYKKLSAGGEQTHPLQDTHWGALFGMLTDRYKNHWLLNCNKTADIKK